MAANASVADRRASADSGRGGWSEGAIVAAALALHVLAWTLFATLSHTIAHHDMTEAYAWGQEWQLGYYKHPPFFSWMAAAWFAIFPRQSWAFFLLSEVNAAIGLAGGWAIARRLLRSPDDSRNNGALAALAMLMLTPLYGIAAIKFNANTALLSLWPWTTYALIRMLEQPRGMGGLAWGVLFGLLAAAAFLTKYYSGLLLVACLAAALLHPNSRVVFHSAAPYVSVLVGGAAIAPHVVWLVASGYQTLHYAAATTQHPTLAILGRGAGAVAQAIAVHVLPLLALGWSLTPTMRAEFWPRFRAALADADRRWILALAAGPFLLSFVALLLAHVRISAQFMIPIFYMVPTAVLVISRLRIDDDAIRRLARPVVAVCLAGLIGGPLGGFIYFKSRAEIAVEPRAAVANEVTRLWRDAFGRRLEIVSGDETYSQAATFYSADRPSDFTNFNVELAPWISRRRVDDAGLAVICKAAQTSCVDAGTAWLTPASRRVEIEVTPRHLWFTGKPQRFVVILTPPRLLVAR